MHLCQVTHRLCYYSEYVLCDISLYISPYNRQILGEKIEEAAGVIKKYFNLPKDITPKWYLEHDVDLKEPDEYPFAE